VERLKESLAIFRIYAIIIIVKGIAELHKGFLNPPINEAKIFKKIEKAP